jgi:hypothetical protein
MIKNTSKNLNIFSAFKDSLLVGTIITARNKGAIVPMVERSSKPSKLARSRRKNQKLAG